MVVIEMLNIPLNRSKTRGYIPLQGEWIGEVDLFFKGVTKKSRYINPSSANE